MRMKKRIAVFASGGGTDFQSLIDAVNRGEINAEICCLIAGKPDIYAIQRAINADIPYVIIRKKDYKTTVEFDEAILEALKDCRADFAVLAGYLDIVGNKTVDAYENKIINIHPSLIPSFCGMGFYGKRVHKAVLESGVKITGATVHFVDKTADTGPIIMQETVPVYFEDTVEDISMRVLKSEHKMLPKAVALMANDRLEVIENRVKILKGEEE